MCLRWIRDPGVVCDFESEVGVKADKWLIGRHISSSKGVSFMVKSNERRPGLLYTSKVPRHLVWGCNLMGRCSR